MSHRLPVNASCQWNITAPVGKVVRIKVLATFRLLSRSCNDVYIKILDGPSNSSDLITKYCNDDVWFHGYFFSSGRFVFLELKTGTGSIKHLRVMYYAVPSQSNYRTQPLILDTII